MKICMQQLGSAGRRLLQMLLAAPPSAPAQWLQCARYCPAALMKNDGVTGHVSSKEKPGCGECRTNAGSALRQALVSDMDEVDSTFVGLARTRLTESSIANSPLSPTEPALGNPATVKGHYQ